MGFSEKMTPENKSEEDEEISFSFDKIKNFFKKERKPRGEHKPDEISDEEVQFGIAGLTTFFDKHKNKLIPSILILVVLYFCISIRIAPFYLPVTDDWAKESVYNYYKNQVRLQIEKEYPNLPELNKDQQVEKRFEEFLKEQKQAIDQNIKGTSDYFKSMLQDENGKTYVLDIDPYFWMRYAQNVLKNGHPGDEIQYNLSWGGGHVEKQVLWDTHMMAPGGRPVPNDVFHAYFEAYTAKFVQLFNKDASLRDVIFCVPLLLMSLAIIPAFFIGRRISGNFGGFIAAFVVVIHPSMLVRSSAGGADTDPYVVLFPLLITWLFLEAFEADKLKNKLVLSGLTGFFVGLFSFAWGGWWFIFDFIVITTISSLFYYVLVHRAQLKDGINKFVGQKEVKNTLFMLICIIIFSGIFTTLFTDFETFEISVTSPFAFTKLKQVAISSVWPNVFTTVAEQNPASLDSVISTVGFGKWFFFLFALIGIILTMTGTEKKKGDIYFIIASMVWLASILLIRPQNLFIFLILITLPIGIRFFIAIKEKNTTIDVKVAILFIMWVTATIYASIKGVRFGLLLIPVFALSFGVAFGVAYNYLSHGLGKGLHINSILAKIVVIVLLSAVLIAPYSESKSIGSRQIPLINDAWYSSLTKIRLESKPNAIINSWWDYGHWFKMIGDRAVTFDGTSQENHQAHWIGNALLTNSEDVSIGILRMLDCSGYMYGVRAFDELDLVIEDVSKSVNILYEIIVLDKDTALKRLMEYGLSNDQASLIVNDTHCEPPDDYFITSEDMVGKGGVWAHFGSWNFERALIYNTIQKNEYNNNEEKSIGFLMDRFNYSKTEAEKMYYEAKDLTSEQANSWISSWPTYVGGVNPCEVTQEKILCPFLQGTTLDIDKSTMDATITVQNEVLHPDVLTYATKDGFEVEQFNNTIGFGYTLVPDDNGYHGIISGGGLPASMFTRLFYIDGHGLSHFKKFSDATSINGGRVIVWKIDWEGKEKNVLDIFKPEVINATNTIIKDENKNSS